MSASAFAQLILDHGLCGDRREKRCSHAVSSSARFWLSIHPQASAASSAVAYVSVLAALFFGIRRKTAADRAWFARSHASHSTALPSASSRSPSSFAALRPARVRKAFLLFAGLALVLPVVAIRSVSLAVVLFDREGVGVDAVQASEVHDHFRDIPSAPLGLIATGCGR